MSFIAELYQQARANAKIYTDYHLENPDPAAKTVTGIVVRGGARGRLCGMPTANVHLDIDSGIPDGIYITLAQLRGRNYSSFTTATWTQGKMLVECHLFDFSGDLYGETLTITFLKRIDRVVAFPTGPY